MEEILYVFRKKVKFARILLSFFYEICYNMHKYKLEKRKKL